MKRASFKSILALSMVCMPRLAMSGAWLSAPSMPDARYYQTATTLADGRVLVAGGTSDVGLSTTTLIYDPASNSWSATGPLLVPRTHHTATLLANGKVLVTGGQTSSTWTAEAELYDPASGSWSVTGSMSAPRWYHAAALLSDGRILVVGGLSASSTVLASAEIYNPATGSWSAAGSMAGPRSPAVVTLPNGHVLAAGGNAGAVSTAEAYDPQQNAWSSAGQLSTGYSLLTLILLQNGNVLAASDLNSTNEDLYNPATNAWTPTAPLLNGPYWTKTTLLSDGTVLTAGPNQQKTGTIAYIYNPASTQWSPTGQMSMGRINDTANLLPNGRVLAAGGQGVNFLALSSAELYDPTLPPILVTQQPSNQSVTAGQTATFSIAASGGTGALSYRWQSSTDGLNFTDVPAAPNSPTYSVVASTSMSNTFYRCHVVDSLGVNGFSLPASLFVTAATVSNPGTTTLSACGAITQNGNYVLGQDLSATGASCLTLQNVAGVNLDCQGHAITTSQAANGPISLNNVQQFSIAHCTLIDQQGNTAITMTNVANGAFSQNLSTGNVNISAGNAGGSVSGIQVSDNQLLGSVNLTGSQNGIVQNNAITCPAPTVCTGGILSTNGSANHYLNNTIDGRWVLGTGHLGGDDGIILQVEQNSFVQNNRISNTWDCGVETVGFVQNTTISGNIISNTYIGIGGWYWNSWLNNIVQNNFIQKTTYMFELYRMYGLDSGFDSPDGKVYFQGNRFSSNTFTHTLTPNPTYQYHAIGFDQLAAQGISASQAALGNNSFDHNNFGFDYIAPTLMPTSMIVDGGSNACLAPSGPYPLVCGSAPIIPPLSIATQPANVSAPAGATVTFGVAATGGLQPLWYQWQVSTGGAGFNNITASIGKTQTLVLSDVAGSMTNSSYRCIIADSSSSVITSNAATLTVTTAPVPTPSTPPAVSIAPLSTTTVSGTITLTASASSNLGIASVQFQLDGNNLGSPLTSSPFALTWNPVSVSPGNHTLTAIATDIAGNKTTSAPITVVRTADATPGLRNALAIPNPAFKTDPVIRAFLGMVNSVEITIFDASGHTVNSGSVSGVPTGVSNNQFYYDYKWTGSKASGVYFAVVHGKAADGSIIRARVRFAVVM